MTRVLLTLNNAHVRVVLLGAISLALGAPVHQDEGRSALTAASATEANVSEASVFKAQETVSYQAMTYSTALCVPASGGRITYHGHECGGGRIVYTSMRTVAEDIRPGVNPEHCAWWRGGKDNGWLAMYLGFCGVKPTVVVDGSLPLSFPSPPPSQPPLPPGPSPPPSQPPLPPGYSPPGCLLTPHNSPFGGAGVDNDYQQPGTGGFVPGMVMTNPAGEQLAFDDGQLVVTGADGCEVYRWGATNMTKPSMSYVTTYAMAPRPGTYAASRGVLYMKTPYYCADESGIPIPDSSWRATVHQNDWGRGPARDPFGCRWNAYYDAPITKLYVNDTVEKHTGTPVASFLFLADRNDTFLDTVSELSMAYMRTAYHSNPAVVVDPEALAAYTRWRANSSQGRFQPPRGMGWERHPIPKGDKQSLANGRNVLTGTINSVDFYYDPDMHFWDEADVYFEVARSAGFFVDQMDALLRFVPTDVQVKVKVSTYDPNITCPIDDKLEMARRAAEANTNPKATWQWRDYERIKSSYDHHYDVQLARGQCTKLVRGRCGDHLAPSGGLPARSPNAMQCMPAHDPNKVRPGWCSNWKHLGNSGDSAQQTYFTRHHATAWNQDRDSCFHLCDQTASCNQAVFETADSPWGVQCWLGSNTMTSPPPETFVPGRNCENKGGVCTDFCYSKAGWTLEQPAQSK